MLLDSSTLIAALDPDGTTSDDVRRTASTTLEALLVDPNAGLVITPLIRHEIVRGLPYSDGERAARLAGSPAAFESLDVSDEVSDLATEPFRFDPHERVPRSPATLEKRRFDVFHFATGIVFGLEFVSQDLGTSKPTALHERLVVARRDGGGVAWMVVRTGVQSIPLPSLAVRPTGPPASRNPPTMIEIQPHLNRIEDLRQRADSLRGYL